MDSRPLWTLVALGLAVVWLTVVSAIPVGLEVWFRFIR